MDELDYALEVLREENALLCVMNATLRDKITELKAKLTGARKNSNNSLKPPSTDIITPYQQKKRNKNHKIGS